MKENACLSLFNLLFILVCFIHLCYIGYYVVYPEYPTITEFKEEIKDLDFPLVFRLCINEPTNGSIRFENAGYKAFAPFFYGESKYNKTVYGWKGHFENGSTFTSVEGKVLI